ncbi:MAG: MBL fold metallo-hydrolase [Deltaproteobacteria bacterium]|nr:MBL fold metallo-hydrolase [Deltaproteobacteria bacterium]
MKKVGLILILAIVALLLFAFTYGNKAIDVSKFDTNSTFVKDDRLLKHQNLPAISFSIIKTGEAKTLEAFVYSGGGFKEHIVSHTSILIRHPKAFLLFDTGLGTQIDQQFKEGMPYWIKPLMAYEKKGDVVTQLRLNNIDSNEIKIILASHLHWDHASGIEDFPQAKIWSVEEEHEWGKKVASVESGVILSQFDSEKIQWDYFQFDETPYENFKKSIDVFSDGSIVLVPLRGHTPGSFGMFLNLRSGKRFFFTGDTTWAIEGIQIPAEKHWISGLLVDSKREQTIASIVQVHKLMQEYPKLNIIPAHDNKVHEKIGFFPKFIQ